MFDSLPGARSVRAYAAQFGLGGEYSGAFWIELENYAALDQLDRDVEENPQRYAAWMEAQEILEFGSARIMGDWPESQLLRLEDVQ